MGWEPANIMYIKGTKMTPYGATVCNYGDHHDITISATGSKAYSSIIAEIGQNYFYYHDSNTCEPNEPAVWVEVFRNGPFSITNMSTTPYYDRTDSQDRKYYSYRHGIELKYNDQPFISISSSGSTRYNPGVTPTHVPFIDKICFGFIVDHSRSYGEVLIQEHMDDDDQYYWQQRSRPGTDSDMRTCYNIITGNMLNYQAVNYITGNGNTYNLSKILTINGGDPVSNAPSSSVNLNNASRIDSLIQNR